MINFTLSYPVLFFFHFRRGKFWMDLRYKIQCENKNCSSVPVSYPSLKKTHQMKDCLLTPVVMFYVIQPLHIQYYLAILTRHSHFLTLWLVVDANFINLLLVHFPIMCMEMWLFFSLSSDQYRLMLNILSTQYTLLKRKLLRWKIESRKFYIWKLKRKNNWTKSWFIHKFETTGFKLQLRYFS